MRISDWSSDVCSSDLFLHRPLAHALERGERVAHRITILMRLDRETGLARVEIGREAGDAEATHIVHEHAQFVGQRHVERSEEHTSELQSLMRISYAVFCLKKKTTKN